MSLTADRLTISKAHKCVLVPEHQNIHTLWPDAPTLDGRIIVPHTIQATLVLRHLGFKCPSPLVHYDWCGGKPFDVQVRTCEMLIENRRAYVLNHMGTGKTKAALWAWDYLNKQKYAKKLLVIAPLSTLQFVWAREAFLTLPGRTVQVLHGSREERLSALAIDADIYVINHDGVRVIQDELFTRADIDTLVLDELAVYRNNSERSKTMRKFAQRFNIVWGMTGAPMPNEPLDVWAQCKIVTPRTVPMHRGTAQGMLMIRVAQWTWKPKIDAVQTAFSWMQPAVRYTLDDVTELPDMIQRPIDVPMSAQQLKTYNEVAKDLRALVAQNVITAVNGAVAIGKLVQIAGGWVYTRNPQFVRLDNVDRVVMLFDLITSAAQKVIVFVPYRHAIEGLSKLMKNNKINIEHAVVHGDVPDRDTIFTEFQTTPKYKVLLAHPQCMAHGLTLTAADTIIWYQPTASLDIFEQANARIRRVGQQHKQQLFMMAGSPAERKLYRLLTAKQKVQTSFLDMFEDAPN